MQAKTLLALLFLLVNTLGGISQNETSLLIDKYSNLLEEVKENYKTADAGELEEYKKQFNKLNDSYSLFKEDLSEEKKEKIHKLKGEIQGYLFLRDMAEIKEKIKKGFEDLKSKSEGFIAAMRVNGKDCPKEFENWSYHRLLKRYKKLTEEVEKHGEAYSKAEWEKVENTYDCLNYAYYQRKDSLSEEEKEKISDLYKRYNTVKYKWKLKKAGKKLKKGMQSLEKEAEMLFE